MLAVAACMAWPAVKPHVVRFMKNTMAWHLLFFFQCVLAKCNHHRYIMQQHGLAWNASKRAEALIGPC